MLVKLGRDRISAKTSSSALGQSSEVLAQLAPPPSINFFAAFPKNVSFGVFRSPAATTNHKNAHKQRPRQACNWRGPMGLPGYRVFSPLQEVRRPVPALQEIPPTV